jgi:UDP-N-acetylmuramoyl-L-alanine---L-glutamate ligase
MRPSLGWSDLAHKRVGIFGAGTEGSSASQRLASLTNDVVVVDDDPTARLEGFDVVATSAGGLELLATCDVVIKSPGISRYRPDVQDLETRGIPVVGGTGLSLHDLRDQNVICITGTKGKSTTTSIVHHLLNGLGISNAVAGNLGVPLFDVSIPNDVDVYVVETSSFQVLDIENAPRVVVVTSLAADHVDWHGSAEQYQRDKLSLTSLPGSHTTIVQGRDEELRKREALLGGNVIWSDDLAGTWAGPLGLVGEHNWANAQLARLAIEALGIDVDDERLAKASQGFEPLPGRLSKFMTIEGVTFVDDSLATNVLPTLAALDAFEGDRLAILIGGYDRGIDYDALIDALARRTGPTFVLGLPDSGATLVTAIESRTSATVTKAVASIDEAVSDAFEWARPEGVVLLSPAAPSFSQFANWKERSDAFRRSVESLAATPLD